MDFPNFISYRIEGDKVVYVVDISKMVHYVIENVRMQHLEFVEVRRSGDTIEIVYRVRV
ncbi:MAG: hypothetical protein QXQ91_04635 [Nanopusillaceae archaeon]